MSPPASPASSYPHVLRTAIGFSCACLDAWYAGTCQVLQADTSEHANIGTHSNGALACLYRVLYAPHEFKEIMGAKVHQRRHRKSRKLSQTRPHLSAAERCCGCGGGTGAYRALATMLLSSSTLCDTGGSAARAARPPSWKQGLRASFFYFAFAEQDPWTAIRTETVGDCRIYKLFSTGRNLAYPHYQGFPA